MRPLLYQRDLPGGGYVAIDALASDDGRWHARLWVERRPDPARRAGHPPPIVLEADDADLEAAVAPLLSVAADNLALAQALRRRAGDAGSREHPGGGASPGH
jgi:hypothetical protein